MGQQLLHLLLPLAPATAGTRIIGSCCGGAAPRYSVLGSPSCPPPPPPSPFFRPVGRTSFILHHLNTPPLGSRGVLCCRIKKGSDIISELELGRPEERRAPNRRVNGIFWILLLNIGVYVADHLFQMREIKALYLYHSWPSWYQFVTSTFCHANWNHLSSNLFFLYIFGKLVEEEEGNFALWISYILTGAGANLVSWLVLPRAAVSVGASGAVFGLFAISVLVKMSWDWRKILEVLILGQFVIDKVMEAAQASTGLADPLVRGSSLQNVNHIAHLSGALIGVALVLLISRIPSHTADHDVKTLRGDKDTRK